MKKVKWYVLSIFCIGVIFVGSMYLQHSGYAEEKTSAERQAKTVEAGKVPVKSVPTVKVETVETAELTTTMELTGSVIPTMIAKLASPAEGPLVICTIGDCKVREGDKVKKGQKLFQIGRNKAAEAQLASARQALQEQTAELQRMEQLAEAGAIPGAQVDTARSHHENAKAQLAKSLESNADYSVTAPWDGIVAKINFIEGEYVAPRAVLAEIFDPQSLVVQFAVPEAKSTEVELGMVVLLQLDAYPGKTLQAEISRVFPSLDEKMRTRTVEATLSSSAALIPGMFARIQVILSRIPDTISVPAYSMVVTPDGSYTAFVVENGKAVKRTLNIGAEVNGRVQVLNGLQAGDQLVISGQEKLKDKATVKVIKTTTIPTTPTPPTDTAVKAGGRS